MKNLNPFFTIGTVGMIVTSILHIFLAIILSLTSTHSTFFALYPTFIAFLAIGLGQIIKKDSLAAGN